jgi:hypothetical protein
MQCPSHLYASKDGKMRAVTIREQLPPYDGLIRRVEATFSRTGTTAYVNLYRIDVFDDGLRDQPHEWASAEQGYAHPETGAWQVRVCERTKGEQEQGAPVTKK